MHEGERAEATDLLGARVLREWITGQREEHSRVFLVESGAPAHEVARVARHDDVILLPVESATYAGLGSAVHYSGALRDVGDELYFGERGVELQDYVAAAFVQIVGPTAVRFFDESSWRAFLDDADLARRTGVFPSALLDPRVLLANRSALTDPDELETPRALRMCADGRVGIGLQGEIIGSAHELPAVLTVSVPRTAALGGVVPRAVLAADLARREWIARYLNATDLMKMLRLGNGAVRISGFGWSLVDDDLADAEPQRTDPFLLDTADGFVLADTTTLRRQLLSPSTAVVVAVTQTSSSLDVAADRLARQRGTTSSEARTLCLEAVSALSVHVGGRIESSGGTNGVEE
jgi:hypothetical protein